MTFATEKAKAESERFMLMKLTPARYISEDMASAGGGIYDIDWEHHIEKIERNGTELTEVSSSPNNNDEWWWDQANQKLEIKLAAAPSSTNIIVVYYNLYYTSGEHRITTKDPEDSNTDEVMWEPRLEEEPSVKQSIRDTVDGTLSTAITSIRIANPDDALQTVITPNDSWFKKKVTCWLCINDITSPQKIFEGYMQRIAVDSRRASITVFDSYTRLDVAAYMGDTSDEAYFKRSANSFPNLDAQADGEPCKMVLAKFSPYKTKAHPTTYNHRELDPDSMMKAYCTSFTENISASTNRTWGLVRTLSDGLGTPSSFPSINQVTNSGNITMLRVSAANYANMDIRIGDSYRLVQSGDDHIGHVTRIITIGANTEIYFHTTATTTPGYTTSVTTTPQAISALLKDGGNYHIIGEGLDFSVTENTTSGGNKYIDIDFKTNFESRITGVTALDPSNHDIVFRLRCDTTSLNHADIMKAIVEAAGITTNTASFTAAASALTTDVAFMIPQIDETDYGTYRSYAELIAKSTLGALYTNNSFELEYLLLSAPVTANVVDGDLYETDSIGIEVEYQDIKTELIFYNPHNESQESIDGSPSPNRTASNEIAMRLHGFTKSEKFRHVLEVIDDIYETLLYIHSNRRVVYSFKTATNNVDTVIGVDLQLETTQVLGGYGFVYTKVVSTDKSAMNTIIEVSDLYGI